MAVFISSITATMMELSAAANSSKNNDRLLREYMGSHSISAKLVISIKRHTQELQSLQDAQSKEKEVMKLLPQQLAGDLLDEVRSPVVQRNGFFSNLKNNYPRALRNLCHQAMHAVPVHRWEVVFELGDACNRMLFVDRGELLYELGQEAWTPNSPTSHESQSSDLLHRCSWVSEPALWLEWRNQGKLSGGCHSSVLAIDHQSFSSVIREYRDAYLMAIAFAKQFLSEILALDELLSDIFQFQLDYTVTRHTSRPGQTSTMSASVWRSNPLSWA
jgi:hypothetical protein